MITTMTKSSISVNPVSDFASLASTQGGRERWCLVIFAPPTGAVVEIRAAAPRLPEGQALCQPIQPAKQWW